MNKNWSLLGIRIINVQSNGHPPKRKPVIMRRKYVWSVERMWAENATTIKTRISKETKRFSRMARGSSTVSALNIANKTKGSDKRGSPRCPQQELERK